MHGATASRVKWRRGIYMGSGEDGAGMTAGRIAEAM